MSDSMNASENPESEGGGTWGDTANLILGFWLFCAPPVLGIPMARRETWISAGLGLLLAAMAGAILVSPRMWKEVVIVAIGVSLIAAPWMFRFSTDGTASWNSVICGGLAVAFGVFRFFDIRDHGRRGHDHGVPAA